MSKTKIYLKLSSEVENILADNEMNIEDILESNNIELDEITRIVSPYHSEEDARSKDLVTLIVASSASIATIGFTLSKVLKEFFRKPQIVEIYENRELLDQHGNLIFDDSGNPIFKPVKRYEILQPEQNSSKYDFEFSFGLKNGFLIRLKSEESNNLLEE